MGGDLQKIDDAELVRRAITADGDPEVLAPVFEEVAGRYCDKVLRWCASRGLDHHAAQDVGQTVFLDAFTSLADGRGPRQGDLLGRWLAGFAKNRLRAHYRQRGTGEQILFSADDSFDDLADDPEQRSGAAVRLAHANRLVNVVVASLEERYRQIYQLYFVEQLTGRQIAERLEINEKTASNRVTRVQQVVADGFGALILAQEGRPYCPVLVGLLDDAQVHAITEENFTAALRTRIVHHFDTCDKCDRCRTCADKRRQLVGPYAPALIPVLFGTEFRDRVAQIIRQVCGRRREPPRRKTRRRPRLRARTSAIAGTALVIAVAAAMILIPRPGHSRPAAALSSASSSSAGGGARTAAYPRGSGPAGAVSSASPSSSPGPSAQPPSSGPPSSGPPSSGPPSSGPPSSGPLSSGPPSSGSPSSGPPGVRWRQLRVLTDPTSSAAEAIAVSPDGTMLATGHYDGSVYLWNLGGSQSPATLSTGSSTPGAIGVESLAFSPDGKTLAEGLDTGQIILRNVANTQVIATLDNGYGQGGIHSLAFSPDGAALAAADMGQFVALWDLGTDHETATLHPGLANVVSVAYSPDGQTVAVGCDDGSVLWDPATGTKTAVSSSSDTSGAVTSVAFSPDGKTLAIGGFNGAMLRNLATGSNAATFPDSTAALAFSPDGKLLATGDNGVSLWDTATGQNVASFSGVSQVSSIAFLPDGTTLAANDGNGVIMWTSGR